MRAACVIFVLLFVLLAAGVWFGTVLPFDMAGRDAVHAMASPMLTTAMRGATELGAQRLLIPLGVVVVALLLWAGDRRGAVWLVSATLGGTGINELLKVIFHRPRPSAFFGYEGPSSYSFPSGHAFAAICSYGVLAALAARRLDSRGARVAVWSTAAVLIAAIGFSRVYLGVHYPSDALAGYALAIAWAKLCGARIMR